MAEAPLPRASSTAARMSAWTTPWPRRSARTKKQGKSHTISSSSRTRFLMILFRGSVAATYRDRGPQAHQPTGSAACEAKIPIGVELAAAIAPNRRWLPPLSQPAANWLRVTQNAMHQQRRVVLWLSNSLLRSGRSFDSTSRVSIAAPMDKTLPRPGRKPTSGTPRGFLLKLQEDVGELTQAFLMVSGGARERQHGCANRLWTRIASRFARGASDDRELADARSAYCARGAIDLVLGLADTHHSIAGRKDRILQRGIP